MNIDEREEKRLQEEQHREERNRLRKERIRKRTADSALRQKMEDGNLQNAPLRRKRKIKWFRLILVLIIFVAFLATVAMGIFKAYEAVMSYTSDGKQVTTSADSTQGTESKPSITTVPFQQKSLDKPLYVLVVGKDNKSPAEADAIFLLAMNEEQKTVDIIGIPSNSKIESRDKKSVQKLNTIYSSGGIDLTKAVVEDIFHIVIPYYVIADDGDFKEFVDIYGSPSMYVEKTMYYEDASSKYKTINLAQGYQTLNPEQSFQYVRYVDQDKDSFTRMQRQERFLKTMLKNQENKLTFAKMWDVWRLWSHFDSNISTYDAVKMSFKLRSLENKNLNYYILPGVKENIDNDVLWSIDPTEAQRLVGITMGTNSEIQTTAQNSERTENTSRNNERKEESNSVKTGI